MLLLSLLLAANPTPLELPGIGGPIGFDDLTWAPALGKVLVPSGASGKLSLIDPVTREVSQVSGFSTEAKKGGHGDGTTSADFGGGFLFASDRGRAEVTIIDPKSRAILAHFKLAAGPDYVRWVEPLDFPRQLARPLDDFTEGESLIEGGTEYQVPFDPGTMLLTDPFLVHKTLRDSDGLRLSIDFRFLTKYAVESDAVAPGTRSENYLPYPEWAEIGRSSMLATDAPLALYAGPDVATANEYAAPFTVVPRNG